MAWYGYGSKPHSPLRIPATKYGMTQDPDHEVERHVDLRLMIPWRTEKAGFSRKKTETQKNITGQEESQKKRKHTKPHNKNKKLDFPQCFLSFFCRCGGCLLFFLSILCFFLVFDFLACLLFACSGFAFFSHFFWWNPLFFVLLGLESETYTPMKQLSVSKVWQMKQECRIQYHQPKSYSNTSTNMNWSKPTLHIRKRKVL